MTDARVEPDTSLLRVACASLDESVRYLDGRIGTYDEQPGERDASRRAHDASRALKLRLATAQAKPTLAEKEA